jgi:plastocyanin
MFLKRTSLLLAVAAAALMAGAASAAPAASHAALVIQHQMRGCHAWSLDGGALKAKQSVTLRRGGVLTLRNNDVMPHTLVLTSGPKVAIAHATLGKVGASLTVTFTKPGVYHFKTKAGEDYPSMSGLKTIGEDNVLRLTVVVT